MSRTPAYYNHASQTQPHFEPDSSMRNPPASGRSQYASAGHPQSSHYPNANYEQVASQQYKNQQYTNQPYANGRGQMPHPSRVHPRAPTQIDDRSPDYWHNEKSLMCINRRYEKNFPHSVTFRPTIGPCRFGGVALLNLELGRGMVDGNAHLDELLSPDVARYTNGALLIDWPGYRQKTFVLTLVDPRTRRHVTRAALGAQVTQHFKDFVNAQTEKTFFEEKENATLLGIDGVMYDQVRLAELYTKDGMTFHPQWAMNAHYLAMGA
ncbi:hypothetical protein C8R43DRAFT_1208654 [Mycena crocata]|nr:hypothetical protein C8R43DRAFT_1208654 [Mycena crocata]